METTINSIIKHNALPTAALSVLIYLQVGMGGDIQDVREDIQTLREDVQTLRAEMNTEFRAIRAEIAEVDKSIRAELSNTNERLARVETRLTSVERVLYADLDPPPQ